jgi:anti-sigma B factor antagonist
MDVTLDPQLEDKAVVHLVGRLDLLSAGAVKEQLASAVAQGYRHLVVDLEGVPFMDSSGLGALIGGLKTTRLAGGDLRVARPAEQTAMILQLTNLNRILGSYETIAAALADI